MITEALDAEWRSPMLSRRYVMQAGFTLAAGLASFDAFAAAPVEYSDAAFDSAQKEGKSILIDVSAPWCPTCKAQAPILMDLENDPKFMNFTIFHVDFDSQKPVLKRFGVRTQSTLIAFKGPEEKGRSVGDTDAKSIAALFSKAA
jgi:thiol-disulfide isomerase/thioredoxin